MRKEKKIFGFSSLFSFYYRTFALEIKFKENDQVNDDKYRLSS